MLKTQVDELITQIKSTTTAHKLNELKSQAFGKSGLITNAFQEMKSISKEDKKQFGQSLNIFKIELEEAFSIQIKIIELAQISSKINTETIDITLPERQHQKGSLNLITHTAIELIKIMEDIGFKLTESIEIENEKYNFDSLNFAEDHPSKQMHDTFYIKPDTSKANSQQSNTHSNATPSESSKSSEFNHSREVPDSPAPDSPAPDSPEPDSPANLPFSENSSKFLLRTHATNMQARVMQISKPPFAFISHGKTYRHDSDKTHSPMFHQLDCFCVNENANMANLKWIINNLLTKFFSPLDFKTRLRPSYFPFTEPSAEIDINLNDNWLEVMGCGMIHPNILSNFDIDPTKYKGIAFGLGIERFAMLKHGIHDLRDFFSSTKHSI